MSVKDLLQVQVGKETTWGTSAAATAKLMGIEDITLQPKLKGAVNADMRGSLGPGQIAYIQDIEGAGKLKTKVLYEDWPYWMDALFGTATPTGAGPYVYAYTAPVAAPTSRMQTLYYGDSNGTYKLLGATPTKVSIKGESNKELTADIDLIGKQVTTGTLAALDDRAVSPVMGNDLNVYIDAWNGTIGTTLIPAMAYSFTLEIDTGRTLAAYLGSLTPGAYKDQRFGADKNTLKLSLEFTATTKAYLDSIIGGTLSQYQVRLKATTGASAIWQMDFAGSALDAPDIFSDKDGVCTLDMTLSATYNSTLGSWCKASVTNSVSALA